MTTPSPQQPRRAPEPHRYHPITFDQLSKPAGSPLHSPVSSFFCASGSEPFGELTGPLARCFAVPLLAFIFFYTERMPFVSPLLILVLLGCLVSRMEGSVRQVAAVPLALAAVKLSFATMSYLAEDRLAHPIPSAGLDPGLYWLPVFFSSCLAFIRNKETVTFKLIFVSSCILLASGLLPGQAFLAIFYMLDVLLFFGVVIAIFMDLSTYLQKQPDRGSVAAR